jgi:hypothetical protein
MPSPQPALDVEISFPPSETEFAQAILGLNGSNAEALESMGFDGGGDFTTVLLALTPFALKALIEILRAHTERCKNVKIKAGGVTIEGADPERIEAILTQLLKRRHGA